MTRFEEEKMKEKKKQLSIKTKALLIILLLPITVTVLAATIVVWLNVKGSDFLQKSANSLIDLQDRHGDVRIPEEYIPIYMAAEEAYNVPWTLLAAHHRIETRFSTMDPLLSPVGAEGHMQFMPCTFVGWSYPGCGGLGEGNIPDEDKTNPDIIKAHGGYGIDANGDGIADPYDIEDAIFSSANYLSASGAADGEIEKAVFEYNRSEKYLEDIMFYYNKFEEARDALESYVVKK